MKKTCALFLVWLIAGCATMKTPDAKLNYPVTAKTNQVDVYHGTTVADPYRWLEDDNFPATKEWVTAENKLTFGFLEKIPQRAAIKERLTKLWNYERFGIPFKQGSNYFFTHNDGLQNQAVLFRQDSLEGKPAALLDPNLLSTNGTVSLSGYEVTDDASLIAYGLARAGSDWQEWRVRNVETGQDLPDKIDWVKFSGVSWSKDNGGFYYSRYDEPKKGEVLKGANYFHKLYLHKLGTAQSQDQLIYERRDHKEWNFGGSVTEDGRYLLIHISEGTDTRNRVFYRDLSQTNGAVVELLNDFDASYSFIDNVGSVFYFRTDLKAPMGKVIAIDITQPARAHWKEIIPQTDARLQGVSLVNDQFIADYLRDAHSEIKILQREGTFVRNIDLPGLGTASGFGGKRKDKETFYSFASYTMPSTIYRYDLVKGTSEIYRQPKVAFDPSRYETKQIFYHSKDGTRVPMFITARKGLKLDGKNPTYLYGYGGFDISITPSFSPANAVWLEMGGVLAVANLRGGGEYGEDWHQAGTKLHKQNVFDDFIAAGEWLIANHYTRPARLAIGGRSNGGLLIGACLTQRPNLFGVALPGVGVLDMLRFHKFTIGWAWTSDYGSAEDVEQFAALYAYSPLHQIRNGAKYPATLITTGDHDDRVVPAHSFKFAATLQAAQAGPKPILIRIDTSAGHGAGKPTTKMIDEVTDQWAFVAHEFNLPNPPFAK